MELRFTMTCPALVRLVHEVCILVATVAIICNARGRGPALSGLGSADCDKQAANAPESTGVPGRRVHMCRAL